MDLDSTHYMLTRKKRWCHVIFGAYCNRYVLIYDSFLNFRQPYCRYIDQGGLIESRVTIKSQESDRTHSGADQSPFVNTAPTAYYCIKCTSVLFAYIETFSWFIMYNFICTGRFVDRGEVITLLSPSKMYIIINYFSMMLSEYVPTQWRFSLEVLHALLQLLMILCKCFFSKCNKVWSWQRRNAESFSQIWSFI